MIHGVKTAESDHTNECIVGNNLSGIKHFMNNIYENKYERNYREPLGKSIIRNYKFPDRLKEEEFRFGVPTTGCILIIFYLFKLVYNAKDLLYTCPNVKESEEVKKLYLKTHGLNDPGQQKDRNYNWYVNKDNFVFGKGDLREYEGAKKSLESDYVEANYPKSKIVDKRLEDFRQATSDMVGKGKFRGTLHPSIDENFVFGVSKCNDRWNARKCVQGNLEENAQKFLESDVDLGKSLHHRNKIKNIVPKEYDGERTFGIPSIRSDLKRTRSSITDKKVRNIC
jgi:hypothetical protein